MNIYKSAEDYLERILMLSNKLGSVRSIDIANDMNFSKPSISRAIKNLKNDGYIEVDANGLIILTTKGLALATKVYEKHNVLSTFFISIGISEETALLDACKVEHDLSDETFEALKKHLETLKKSN